MKFWCWLLMGHRWQYSRKRDYLKEGEVWTETNYYQRAYCSRCGAPNPNYGGNPK